MLQRVQQEVRSLLVDDEPQGDSIPLRWRQLLRFWVMVGQAFVRNRCPVRATALAYSSLLAFIPMLAVVIGVSTSILKNDAEKIQGWIKDTIFQIAPQLKNSDDFGVKVDTLVHEITDMISNVHSGAIGTTGVLALLVMVLFMLARVEETMNDIWGATRGRSWYSRLVNYWAAVSLGPIVLFSAIGLSATIALPRLEATFQPADIKSLPTLAARLKNPADPVGAYLLSRLPEATRKALAAYEGPHTTPRPLERELILGLNALIAGPLLHQPAAFANLQLREETRRLLASPPADGSALERLNRLLLEDALPKEIARRPEWLSRYLGGGIGKFLVGLVQIPLLTAACAAFYAFMPATKVHWRAALIGGLVAGILWYLNNTVSTRFVSELTRNKAIYGSLAVIPVMMVGLYFFWMLLLFGAQVAYTYQNRRSFMAARQSDRVNQEGREFVAVRIMLDCARAFRHGTPPPSLGILAERLEVPSHLLNQVVHILLRTNLILETAQTEPGFVPARPLDQIKVCDILTAMRRGVGSRLPTRPDPDRVTTERELSRVQDAEASAGAETLAHLV